MTGLIPFNRKSSCEPSLIRTNFNGLYNMLDDFFNDNWLQNPSRSLLRDTFKIDIQDNDKEYLIEAELPGIKKEEISLGLEGDSLCISINRFSKTEADKSDGKNYIHKERCAVYMNRRVRLADANLDEIKAKLDDGVLAIVIPKVDKKSSCRKIDIT